MLILITYDVSTTTAEGKRRLNKIAKICCNYGQRVQNSVFECDVNPEQWTRLKSKLLQTYQPETDSLRFYMLGSKSLIASKIVLGFTILEKIMLQR